RPFSIGAFGGKRQGHVHQPGAGRSQFIEFFNVLRIVGQFARGGEQRIEFGPLLHVVEGRVGSANCEKGSKNGRTESRSAWTRAISSATAFMPNSFRAPITS